jgi:hypothetical protein
VAPKPVGPAEPKIRGMRASYAVTWQSGASSGHSGRLDLGPYALVLDGGDGGGEIRETVSYDQLVHVRIGRSANDRLSGLRTLVLERRTGSLIRIAAFREPGAIAELAEQLEGHRRRAAAEADL